MEMLKEKALAAKFITKFFDHAPRFDDAVVDWDAVDSESLHALKNAYVTMEGK